jgi:Fe-S-cluster-containing dehydrogenase component
MSAFGIVIDLSKCIRCRACMISCKIENKIPPMEKGRVEHYRIRPVEWEEGKYPEVRRIFIPLMCMNCDDPSCLKVCPMDAISKRADGIVVIDKDKCISCGSCVRACPYGVPFLLGKSDKCDFCAAARLDKGIDEPYCVRSCPGEAMTFGDLQDPKSEVAKLVASGKAKPLCAEFGTKPNVYYVPPKWYEDKWESLAKNQLFLEALSARKRDIQKVAAGASLPGTSRKAGLLASPAGVLMIGALGAGVSLNSLAERKRKVAEKEQRKQEEG